FEVVLREPTELPCRPGSLFLQARQKPEWTTGQVERLNSAVDAARQVVQHPARKRGVGANSRNARDIQGSAQTAVSRVDARRHVEGIVAVARYKPEFSSKLKGMLALQPGKRVRIRINRSDARVWSDRVGIAVISPIRTCDLAKPQLKRLTVNLRQETRSRRSAA